MTRKHSEYDIPHQQLLVVFQLEEHAQCALLQASETKQWAPKQIETPTNKEQERKVKTLSP